jgi:hypothetical protein
MSKNSVLITSIIQIAITIAYFLVTTKTTLWGLLQTGALIFCIVIAFVIYSDAKRRGKSAAFAALGIFLGGIGGLIYYFIIYKDSYEQLARPQPMSESTRKSLLIFSSVLTSIFGLIFLYTIPWTRLSYISWPLTITMGLFTLASALSVLYARSKKQK